MVLLHTAAAAAKSRVSTQPQPLLRIERDVSGEAPSKSQSVSFNAQSLQRIAPAGAVLQVHTKSGGVMQIAHTAPAPAPVLQSAASASASASASAAAAAAPVLVPVPAPVYVAPVQVPLHAVPLAVAAPHPALALAAPGAAAQNKTRCSFFPNCTKVRPAHLLCK